MLLKNLGIYISVFFIIIAGVLIHGALSLPYYTDFGPGPGLLPLWTGLFMLLLAIINFGMSIKKSVIKLSDVLPKGEGLVNLLTVVGSIVLFLAVSPTAGFIVGSTLMLFLLFKRGYKWYWALIFAIAASLITYYLFAVLLQTRLPVNKFGW